MSENTDSIVPEGSEIETNAWETLRRARESLGLSVADVSAHLKLTVRQIEAIERGDLSVLPGAAFARGFVRNYARFLGLDQAVFLQAIEAEGTPDTDALASRMNPAGLGTMPFKGTNRFASLPMALGVLALFVLLSLGAYFRWFESRDSDLLAQIQSESVPSDGVSAASVPPPVAEQSVSPVSSAPVVVVQLEPSTASSVGFQGTVAGASSSAVVAAQSMPASAKQSAPVAQQSVPAVAKQSAPSAATPLATQSGNSASLVLAFEGDSWVEVRDAAGKSILSRLNPAGSSQALQGTPPFTLVVGNAGKVKLNWRGKPVDLTPYIKVDVARLSLQ